jgi:SNF2 family DNA or RNA helicase
MLNYKFKTEPYAHQLKALERSWEKEYFAYFMEMGTGKSKVLIDNAAMLYNQGKINGLLLIAPKGVYKNWYEDQIPTHLPDYINKKVVLWKSSDKSGEQTKKLNTLFQTGTELHILIMNVEAFSYDFGKEFARRFLDSHNAMMAIDESTTIKTPTSNRTKNILKLRTLAKYRRILTGSPVTNSPLDLFSQCQFLGSWLLNTDSYYDFRSRYAEMRTINLGSHSTNIVVGYRNLGELSKLIEPFSMRVLKDDCLDLPEKTFMKRQITMTPQQEKLYKAMKKYAMAQLEGKALTTNNVMVQLMRLHQILCGHFTADDGTIQDIPNHRVTELMEILSEVEGKVVIWSHYQRDIETIIKAIRKKYGRDDVVVDYYGKTTMEDRQDNIKKFQEDDNCRFFVGTTQTGGYGITLTAASTMVYYSNGYDLEKRLQSEARIDRIGQKYPMTYIDIVTEDTIDTKVVKALRKKLNIASDIMGEELKEWI